MGRKAREISKSCISNRQYNPRFPPHMYTLSRFHFHPIQLSLRRDILQILLAPTLPVKHCKKLCDVTFITFTTRFTHNPPFHNICFWMPWEKGWQLYWLSQRESKNDKMNERMSETSLKARYRPLIFPLGLHYTLAFLPIHLSSKLMLTLVPVFSSC